MSIDPSHRCALQVAQQAIALLLKWTDKDLANMYQPDTVSEESAVRRAKELLKWNDAQDIQPLELLFDKISLPDGKGQKERHYHPMVAIANTDPQIPYPLKNKPNNEKQSAFKQEIKKESLKVLQNSENWQNLSLLMLILEKYGSCLSFGGTDVALIDRTRITGAIAAALANDPKAKHLSLIAGDLSGIQNFIYTISSDGALKSLRARSFYLELVTEEVIQQLLVELSLPRTSIIYAGGGNLYLLASAAEGVKEKIKQVRQKFNQWLRETFQKKIFLALDCLAFPIEDVAKPEFANQWEHMIQQLNQQKSQKFADQITDVLSQRQSYELK
jgi:CRISPR-associated protein Csm1